MDNKDNLPIITYVLLILSMGLFIMSNFPKEDNVSLTFIILGWASMFMGALFYFVKRIEK